MKEILLKQWENRPPHDCSDDLAEVFSKEISLLQQLQSLGCTETADGINIQMQIDARLDTIKLLNEEIKTNADRKLK